MFLVSYDQKIPFSSIKSGLVVFRLFLEVIRLAILQKSKSLDNAELSDACIGQKIHLSKCC